ncbi:hypothetical protein [Algoriphagus algorifonticola]|uniref:hypothetical protein n=1 Tax=Algoriphagus algorifonticola TaxID=2593007 RepID=UPI0016430E77|nr:hypothetical protein [Algoriphagus algorifonticola]
MKSKKKKNPNEESEKFDMGSLANQGIFPEDVSFTKNIGCASNSSKGANKSKPK